MSFEITEEMREVMVRAAARAYPREACGLIKGSHVEELPNDAGADSEFGIHSENVRWFAENYGGYDGVWHSHPRGSAEPSQRDWIGHPYGKAMVIVAGTDTFVYWNEGMEGYK